MSKKSLEEMEEMFFTKKGAVGSKVCVGVKKVEIDELHSIVSVSRSTAVLLK